MANPGVGTNLQGMYPQPVPHVREEPASYGPHEVDEEAFPAARVLQDLARSTDEAVPRVVARYAVLRSWLLREAGADPVLVRQGSAAARAYLAVSDGPEVAPLQRLVGREPGLEAFQAAGAEAAAQGHVESAYGLYLAGYRAARQRTDLAWAARLAGALAGLLKAEKLDGVVLWTRRAERLRRLVDPD